MSQKAAKAVCAVSLVLIFVLNFESLHAQDAGTLSGAITDSSGKLLPNAKVSVRNLSTGQSTDTQSDSTGHYAITTLAAGDYEVTASFDGLAPSTARVTITAGSPQTLSLTLPAPQPAATPAENLPNAPSSSQTEPSLSDLGFSPAETQANAKEQALLDKRTHMLKIHQRMGLITTIPLLATVITSVGAGGKSTSTSSRDLHVALGSLTGDLYGITAYYAIRAPRIKGTKKRGPIRFHEAMAWIHGPGMILTPILGAMAFDQKSNGEKVHGIASAHGLVAIVTAGAFGAALLSVSVKF
ncbi:MAG TPA: carboxypeptidase-like regulatory domain-containing protein [Terriglobales bacterium]|nr:carboxypeptidase-like regulatory domain-containing protein [Terriglobales bacterium]